MIILYTGISSFQSKTFNLNFNIWASEIKRHFKKNVQGFFIILLKSTRKIVQQRVYNRRRQVAVRLFLAGALGKKDVLKLAAMLSQR